MSVARINQFQAKPGKGADLQTLLLSLIPGIKKAGGCESAQLLSSHGNPDRLVMLEVWESIEHHQASTREIPQKQIEALFALVAGPPKGGYYLFT